MYCENYEAISNVQLVVIVAMLMNKPHFLKKSEHTVM